MAINQTTVFTLGWVELVDLKEGDIRNSSTSLRNALKKNDDMKQVCAAVITAKIGVFTDSMYS